MAIQISSATSRDISAIQQIAYDTWPATYDKILSAEQTQYMLKLFYNGEELWKQLSDGKQQFLLASDDGWIVGFAGYEPNYNNTKSTKLHKLYVLPVTQGKSVGKKLIEEVVAAIKLLNQESLLLNVNVHNTAIGFYEHLGFKIIERVDIPIGNDYFMNDYVMQLAL